MRTLYPDIEPFDTGSLKVDDRHALYYEQCGNPAGKPVVLLHGGPGGGCSTKMRRFHDPAKYRIVLFDQRGAGRSTPHADLVVSPASGHSAFEAENVHALVEATDRFAS